MVNEVQQKNTTLALGITETHEHVCTWPFLNHLRSKWLFSGFLGLVRGAKNKGIVKLLLEGWTDLCFFISKDF